MIHLPATSESTAEDTTTEVKPTSALDTFSPDERKKIEAQVQDGLTLIASGKKTFSDLLAAVVGDRIPVASKKLDPPNVPEITDEHRAALTSIVDLYGQVAPTEARSLTPDELTAVAREREAIDTITKFLGARKDNGIREIVSNHFDVKAETERGARRTPKTETTPDGEERIVEDATDTDSRGHYVLKDTQTAPGTGNRFERRTAESKPKVTSATIDKAYKAGQITRAEYLSMTEVPEVPRALSEEKMRKAMKKDPGLLFRLADFAEAGTTNTSIWLVEDK